MEETRYYLILAKDLDYGDPDQIIDLLETVSRLLDGYIKGIVERMPQYRLQATEYRIPDTNI